MKKGFKLSLLFTLTSLFTLSSHAAGFQLLEYSAATMGTANAGTTVTDDGSVQFYNPAAMVFFNGLTISGTTSLIIPTTDFEPILGTVKFSPILGGRTVPVNGVADSPGRFAMVPTSYVIYPVNSQFALGMGIETPFGLSTEYNNDSFARYFATKSSLMTFNFNPSMAIKILQNLSFGFGLDLMYAKAELNSTVALPTGDVFVTNKGHDFSEGWNTGLYWIASPTTTFGLAYHSKIKLNLKGDNYSEGVIPPLLASAFSPTGITAPITLPDYGTLSVKQYINSWWDMVGDVSYTHWNVINNLSIFFDNNRAPVITKVNYRNTWRFAVGEEFQVLPSLKLKTGVAWEETPVRNEFRDARLPDENRVWVSVGGESKMDWLMKGLTGTFGYAHLFFKEPAQVNLTNVNGLETTRLLANYRFSANLFSAGFNYHFA